MREKGQALNRRQIDERLAGYDATRGAAENRADAATARAEAAEAELARCKRALESSRLQQMIDREKAAEVTADRDCLRGMLGKVVASNLQIRGNWERAPSGSTRSRCARCRRTR